MIFQQALLVICFILTYFILVVFFWGRKAGLNLAVIRLSLPSNQNS